MKLIKHVWHMICHDRLFSGIYIFGTALALATGTVFAILMLLKVVPVYPEYERNRTYYLSSLELRAKPPKNGTMRSGVSYRTVRDLCYNLSDADIVTAYIDEWDTHFGSGLPADACAEIQITLKPVDPAFFRLYSFDFIAGSPFSEDDFESGYRTAVITDTYAHNVFGHTSPDSLIGSTATIDARPYRICGVVRHAEATERNSCGDIYVPYTTIEEFDSEWRPMLGSFSVVMTSDNPEGLRKEIGDYIARFNNSQDEYELYAFSQPVPHYWTEFSSEQDDEFSLIDFVFLCCGLLLVLMLVPALNLSGIIAGRMESRLPEMGVRKAFGATKATLLRQVLAENLVYTVVGGIIGFAAAWLCLKCGITDILAKGSESSEVRTEVIFSPYVFGVLFCLCLLLNIMSALLPAMRSLRRPIVESLKEL